MAQQHDGFLDPTSGVLRNSLNIKDDDKLAEVEGTAVQLRMMEMLRDGILPNRLDAQGLQAIHQQLFQDIYPWAGELRDWGQYQNIKMSSADGGSPGQRTMFFGSYHTLPAHLDAIGQQLASENNLRREDFGQFIERAAYYFDQYNYAHGFREGNGRTLGMAFTLLGEAAGFNLRITDQVNAKQYNQALEYAILRPDGNGEADRKLLKEYFAHVTMPMEEVTAVNPASNPAASPFLRLVEGMREVQQTQEIIWQALLTRNRPLSREIRETRGILFTRTSTSPAGWRSSRKGPTPC